MLSINHFMQDTDMLRQLVNEQGDLPIIFVVDNESTYTIAESRYSLCDNFCYKKKTILAENPFYEFDYPFDNEEDLKSYIYSYYARFRDYDVSDDTEFNEFVEKEVKQLKPYWKDAIVVYLG